MGIKRIAIQILTLCLALAIAVACEPEYPKCDSDKDCREGEFCINGQCQLCRDNGDCAEGEQCAEGVCEPIPGYCANTDECPPGQVCRQNACDPCSSSAECEGGLACVDGRCMKAQCVTDEDCGPGESCRGGMCGPENLALVSGAGDADCTLDPVYFEFDSSEIDSDSRDTLQQNAKCIEGREGSVVIEGHCDPRGTTEYNMALGDRRARGVKRYLKTLGVPSEKLRPVCEGVEEASGTSESGYSIDRRAEFH